MARAVGVVWAYKSRARRPDRGGRRRPSGHVSAGPGQPALGRAGPGGERPPLAWCAFQGAESHGFIMRSS